MVPLGEDAVGALDLRLRGVARDAEHAMRIAAAWSHLLAPTLTLGALRAFPTLPAGRRP
jgi:hypothetical protein